MNTSDSVSVDIQQVFSNQLLKVQQERDTLLKEVHEQRELSRKLSEAVREVSELQQCLEDEQSESAWKTEQLSSTETLLASERELSRGKTREIGELQASIQRLTEEGKKLKDVQCRSEVVLIVS